MLPNKEGKKKKKHYSKKSAEDKDTDMQDRSADQNVNANANGNEYLFHLFFRSKLIMGFSHIYSGLNFDIDQLMSNSNAAADAMRQQCEEITDLYIGPNGFYNS